METNLEAKTEPVLKLDGISKSFGGIKALQNVSLELYKAEVLAVIGENGAGKSTLMKIIVGALTPDSGIINFDGMPVKHKNPVDAANLGISIVYQEPNIFPELSVLENIFAGNELVDKGRISWKKMNVEAAKALERVSLPADILSKHMGELSIGTQQLVLIARALRLDSKVLILDEPTSILSYAESEKLFTIMGELKKNGISILYISHRIQEILEHSDRMIVLRDGVITESMNTCDADTNRIVSAMSGRTIDTQVYRARDVDFKTPTIEVSGLSQKNLFDDISFKVYPGQIVGMYGLVGSGRSEVARCIFGESVFSDGKIVFEGTQLEKHSTLKAIEKKIFYLPEDRGTQGIFNLRTLKENMTAPFLKAISKFTFINNASERKMVSDNMDKYSIKAASQDALITSLSGGNQQKVIFCRWLLDRPKLLILDEPTRGIDIKTKVEIHNFILDLAEQGVAILLISSDLPEIMALSDEIITMQKGKISATIKREEMTEELILKHTLGISVQDEREVG